MTGVTAWAGQLLIRGAGEESRTRLLVLTMSLVALLTALISVNGAVAALLPVVVVIAVRLKRHSSQLLMPLVFAAHAGSMLALTGTPVNVLVSEAASDAGVGGFGFFEFALVGVPLLAGTMAIIVLFGQRLLPERNGATMPADFSRHAKTLVEQYGLASGIFQMRVRASSPYVGVAPSAIDLRDLSGLQLVAVQEGDPARRFAGLDWPRAITSCCAAMPKRPPRFAAKMHLAFREEAAAGRGEETLFNRRSGLAEVVIPPRSGLIGQTVFPGMVTESGDLIILAVQRAGERDRPPVGDQGMAAGSSCRPATPCCCRAPGRRSTSTSTIPTSWSSARPSWCAARRCRWGQARARPIAILIAMVVLLATGIVPPAVAGLLAAGAIDPVGDHERRAVLPRHRLDDGHPGRRA